MTTETAETQGLRARKKLQTRENISHQATMLFLERGFDKVTIADVAAAAQVAKMTVTNYFPARKISRWTWARCSSISSPVPSVSANRANPRWRHCAAPTSPLPPTRTRSSASPAPHSPR